MNKKVLVVILVALLLVAAVPTVFAAIDSSKQKEIQALYQQMLEIRKQIVDKYLEAGLMTPEQAKLIKDRLDYQAKNPPVLDGSVAPGAFGPGRGFGRGFGGFGRGFGGSCPMWGGYYPGAGQPLPPGTTTR
ncbi:MAG: YckD family protein [Firmicutes bacterium]|nr:YckD family protein [Bacillota bacterium]MCL5039488.1 YckD family protein [Bacillota bacterium]